MNLVATRSSAAGAADGAPTVLLLHGYGSSEDDLAGLGPMVAGDLPWASLRAPLTMRPGAYAWFAITAPGSPDAQPVTEATAAIWAWVDAELGPDAVVLPVGFSQGGLMATQLLRTRPERVAATVVLAGFVLGHPQPADDVLAATRLPVFWGRGTLDGVIAPHATERTEAWLPEHATLTERVYPGLGHGVHDDEIADVRAFVVATTA